MYRRRVEFEESFLAHFAGRFFLCIHGYKSSFLKERFSSRNLRRESPSRRCITANIDIIALSICFRRWAIISNTSSAIGCSTKNFIRRCLAGFAVISHWTPFLFFAVYFGALADRHDCRRMIQASQVMYACVSLTWAILFLTDTIQVWHACVLLVVHGMAGVLGGPGSQLIIHDIVGREYLQSAVRLNSTGRQFGVLFGPGIGGATMLLFGPPAGLFINVLMYLPMIVFMFMLPYTGHGRDDAMSGRAPRVSASPARFNCCAKPRPIRRFCP